MKRKFLLTFAIIACLCGCIGCTEDDTLDELSSAENEVVSRSSSDEELQFIDFVDDESFDSQILVIKIAAERLDKYVSFTGERYVMAPCTPQKVGLSQRVFDYMQGRMEKQNARIDTFKDHVLIDGKVFVYSEIKYMPPRIASRSETVPSGGITAVKERNEWSGTYLDIYISGTALAEADFSLEIIEWIVSHFPTNTLVKTVVKKACDLAGLGISALSILYPNGFIISILIEEGEGEGDCVPFELKAQ